MKDHINLFTLQSSGAVLFDRKAVFFALTISIIV